MFQSTLLKRTMSLVVLSLVASAIIATIAFVVAGKSATLTIELENALKIDSKLNDVFSNNPEYFEDSDFRYFFFGSSYANGHDYYLVNMNGDIVNYTSIENRNLSPTDTAEILTKLNIHLIVEQLVLQLQQLQLIILHSQLVTQQEQVITLLNGQFQEWIPISTILMVNHLQLLQKMLKRFTQLVLQAMNI